MITVFCFTLTLSKIISMLAIEMGETMVEDLTKAVARLGFQSNARPNVEPAGLSFESKICRDINRYGKIFYCGYQYQLNALGSVAARNVTARDLDICSKSKQNADVDMSEFDNISDRKYVAYIMLLNQIDSSDYDFYRILGLSKLRQHATSAQIKAAYHRLILTHHPDKGSDLSSALWKNVNLYFPCILRAYNVLSNPKLRRSYDSYDPNFDNSVPPVRKYSSDEFFAAFAPVFKRNACWSKIKPVPLLGDINTDISEVHAFYSFWLQFESWRECTWDMLSTIDQLDASFRREIRRSMMKQQYAMEGRVFMRNERKRILTLVENARKCDPRIMQYELEMKQKRIEQKRRKLEARRLAMEEERARKMKEEEQEKLQKEKELEKARQEALALKRQKHAAKKAISKEKKKIVAHLEKNDYFAAVGGDKLKFMENEFLLETVLTIDEMKHLNAKLEAAGSAKDAMQAYMEVSAKIDEHRNAEREKLEQQQKQEAEQRKSRLTCIQANENWNDEDKQLVIRGMSRYPAGTKLRQMFRLWNIIADYVNRHSSSGESRTPKAVAAIAKEMLNSDKPGRANATAGTSNLVKKNRAVVEASPTTRYDYEAAEVDDVCCALPEAKSWTPEEVEQFKKAIKMYPPGTHKRWERIIMKLPRRTQVACLRRYNEILRVLGNGNREAFVAYVNPGEVRPWTAEEEKRFEMAVINFPPGSEDRLRRIAEMVGTRTEEECVQRIQAITS
ncbi:DnaJ -like protein subfamily C member 2 [Trichinella papuae]|uniref:DnaJ homolog subfamily C member 2 n=1 Tax=Trichinella papuae TaxID=268474 RepID=A0A0V1M9A1_9BILA|nr:DnaJ -like protein subfamily C member 2 [Trichinella papuae]